VTGASEEPVASVFRVENCLNIDLITADIFGDEASNPKTKDL
jgi:hypothetical protein